MPKHRIRPIDIAIAHGRSLPKFKTAAEARRELLGAFNRLVARGRKVVYDAGGPRLDGTGPNLLKTDGWFFDAPEQRFIDVGSSKAEVDFLLDLYVYKIVADHCDGVRIDVAEDSFIKDRWSLYLISPGSSYAISLTPPDEPPATARGAKRGKFSGIYRHVQDFERHIGEFYTALDFHQKVRANARRLSNRDDGIRTCQIQTLCLGIDAFNERAVISELGRADEQYSTQLYRCLEAMPRLKPSTIDRLIEHNRVCTRYHSLTQVALRHQPKRILALLRDNMSTVSNWASWRFVRTFTAARVTADPTVIAILAHLLQEVRLDKNQHDDDRENISIAIGILWKHARTGDAMAMNAIKSLGRRWRRLDAHWLKQLKKFAPGLSKSSALALGSKARKG